MFVERKLWAIFLPGVHLEKIASTAKQRGRKPTNFSVFSGSVEDFPTTFYLSWQTHKTSQMIDRNNRNYLDRVRKSINCMKNKNSKIWWNLILWTASLPSTWPKVFSQKLVWRNLLYKYCGSRLILKMRSEATFLEKWCILLRFHSVTPQHFFELEKAQLVSQAINADDGQPRISSGIEDHREIIVATNDSVSRLSLYADWLRSMNHTIWYRGYHV